MICESNGQISLCIVYILKLRPNAMTNLKATIQRLGLKFFFFSSSSSSLIYPPAIQDLHPPPGTYNPNARGSGACRGSNSLWARTLDRYTRAGLPERVVSIMSGSPPKTTQDRTQTKDTHPIPGQKLKFLTPPGIEPWPTGWKVGTTDIKQIYSGLIIITLKRQDFQKPAIQRPACLNRQTMLLRNTSIFCFNPLPFIVCRSRVRTFSWCYKNLPVSEDCYKYLRQKILFRILRRFVY